jgi:hypothetical protein
MKRFAIGTAGTVTNVVGADDISQINEGPGADIFEDVAGTVNVGDSYDVKDVSYDRLDIVTHKVIFQLLNEVRVLQAQPQITAAQYKSFVKSLMT